MKKDSGGLAVFVIDKDGVLIFVKSYPLKEKPDLTEILSVLG